MGRQNNPELNKILAQWPQNCVVTSSWLESHGVYRQLVHKYVLGGWIKKIDSGAFQKYGDQVNWQGALFAIQRQMHLPVHLGGASLLTLKGYGQHIGASEKVSLHLYGLKDTKLPRWFVKKNWAAQVTYSRKVLFEKNAESLGMTTWTSDSGILLKTWTVERAFFEMVDDPAHLDFQQVYEVCERLNGLRANLVQELIESCTSIKTKRIFCFMANRANHAWFKKLNLSKVDFGNGKRTIIKKGSFDSKYQITVPKQYAEVKNEE